MIVELDIHETVGGDISVRELSFRNGRYLPENQPFDPQRPTFKDSVSITLLKRHTSGGEELVKAFIHDHSNYDVVNRFLVTDDGWYEVIHLIVPNEQWLAKAQDSLDTFSTVYYVKDNKLYKTEHGEETTVEDLLADGSLDTASVWMKKVDTMVLFNLWQCYLNYCRKLFEGECTMDSACADCDNELTGNRNLIWIFLNTLQYLVRLGEFTEAQKLLEELTTGCNTLCYNEMFSKNHDCGCQ